MMLLDYLLRNEYSVILDLNSEAAIDVPNPDSNSNGGDDVKWDLDDQYNIMESGAPSSQQIWDRHQERVQEGTIVNNEESLNVKQTL